MCEYYLPLDLVVWANGSVGKKKGGDTTTRTEIETAGSGKDLGFWLWPWEPAAAKQHLTLSKFTLYWVRVAASFVTPRTSQGYFVSTPTVHPGLIPWRAPIIEKSQAANSHFQMSAALNATTCGHSSTVLRTRYFIYVLPHITCSRLNNSSSYVFTRLAASISRFIVPEHQTSVRASYCP